MNTFHALITNIACAIRWPDCPEDARFIIREYAYGSDLPDNWRGLALGDVQINMLENLRLLCKDILCD